jgi:preprotein translocase subunit SecF
MSLQDVMKKSLNDTLSRTIITSATIFLVLIVLLVFGGEVNRGFAFTMAFGIVTGTYSSIFIASAFVLDWTKYRNRKTAVTA